MVVVDGRWSAWGPWHTCAGDCEAGMLYKRNRTCDDPAPFFGGKTCAGAGYQETDMGTAGFDSLLYTSIHWQGQLLYTYLSDCMAFGGVTYYDDDGGASCIYWTVTKFNVSVETGEVEACNQLYGKGAKLVVMKKTNRAIWRLIPNLVKS